MWSAVLDFVTFWLECFAFGWTSGNWFLGVLQTGALLLGYYLERTRRLKTATDLENFALKWTSKLLIWSFIVSALAVAPYVKYRKQLEAVKKDEPAFVCNIHYPYYYPLPFDTNRFALVFALQVMNNGAPARIWKWKCNARLLSGTNLPSEAPIEKMISWQEFPIEKYFPIALFEKAIGPEGVIGWAWFPFENVHLTELKRPGVRFEIEFEDARTNKIKSFYTIPTNAVSIR